MSMFKYNDKHKALIAEINGVRFCCEEEKDSYASQAQELAEVYQDRIPEIVAFILDEVCSMFGEVSEEKLTNALGTPMIDLDREVISYLEQSLDDIHIIDVEYGGVLDEFYEVAIDG